VKDLQYRPRSMSDPLASDVLESEPTRVGLDIKPDIEDDMTSVGQDEETASFCSSEQGWSTDNETENPQQNLQEELWTQHRWQNQTMKAASAPCWRFVPFQPLAMEVACVSKSSAVAVPPSQKQGRRGRGAKGKSAVHKHALDRGFEKSRSAENDAQAPLDLSEDELTTIIFRNIPHDCTRDALTAVLDAEGFRGCYDFAHVPVNFQDMAGLSYALVNMVDNVTAKSALAHFQGFQISASNVCSVAWSSPNQGLAAHIERYRNSPMMHESVPSSYKPALYRSGILVPFPEPTRRLRAPRVRHPKAQKP